MSEFFFVVKTALFSALILMLLQMKVAGTTLEEHSKNWIYHSKVGDEMQSVARGAVRAGYDGWDWVQSKSHEKIGATKSRSRNEDLD